MSWRPRKKEERKERRLRPLLLRRYDTKTVSYLGFSFFFEKRAAVSYLSQQARSYECGFLFHSGLKPILHERARPCAGIESEGERYCLVVLCIIVLVISYSHNYFTLYNPLHCLPSLSRLSILHRSESIHAAHNIRPTSRTTSSKIDYSLPTEDEVASLAWYSSSMW